MCYFACLWCFVKHTFFKKEGNNDYFDNNTSDTITQYFDSSLPDGTMEFTNSILNAEDFERIIPLGNINPPGHTFPTDHIYFVLTAIINPDNLDDPNNLRPVFAPTAGKILYIEETGMYGDGSIRVGVTNTMTYYLGHIFVDESLKVGDTVLAGAQLGISGNTSCVDLGVLNKNINNGFLSQKLPFTTIYGDKPLSYYGEPLRSELYALVKPPTPTEEPDYVYDGGVTDGEFAIDKLGSLRGQWFREGGYLPSGWYEWDVMLSFGYDVYYKNQIRIALGSYSNAFAISSEDGPVDPKDVSVASGVVTYYLYNANNTSKGLPPTTARSGLMIVQMLSDTRIKLEIFDDTTSTTRAFTSAALYYVR